MKKKFNKQVSTTIPISSLKSISNFLNFIIGKCSFMHTVFCPPTWLKGWVLGLGYFLTKRLKSPHRLCQAYHLVWGYFSLFNFSAYSLVLLQCVILCHFVNLSAIICPSWEGTESFQHSTGGCAQVNCPAPRDLLALETIPTIEASLCECSIVLSSAWLCCIFLGYCDTRMQWEDVFWFLFLAVSIIMIYQSSM